jgi:hypothetical protein
VPADVVEVMVEVEMVVDVVAAVVEVVLLTVDELVDEVAAVVVVAAADPGSVGLLVAVADTLLCGTLLLTPEIKVGPGTV